MRTILLTASCLMLSSSVATLAQPPVRSFRYQVLVAEYVADPVYVSAPREPARYLFFQGDRIELSLELFNRGPQAFAYRIPQGGAIDLFAVTVVTAPTQDVRPRLTISQYAIKSGGVLRPEKLPASTLDLPPQRGVEFRGTLENVTVPGVYEIRIVPVFREPVINTGVVRFEIRPVSDRAARVEVARRRMWLARGMDDCAQAESEGARLLELHPFASEVYRVRAECAERAGKNQDAVAAYDRARELIVLGLDDLLLANMDPQKVKRWVNGLFLAAESVGTVKTLHP